MQRNAFQNVPFLLTVIGTLVSNPCFCCSTWHKEGQELVATARDVTMAN